MKKILLLSLLLCTALLAGDKENNNSKVNPPIYIAFLWHMHQPIYWPYESIVQTEQNNRWGFSVFDIHNQRTGPYTSWPKDAVMKGINANLPNFGAQVSFSGSLVENLNNLEANGNGNFSNWKSHWLSMQGQKTALNNPRLDLVAFGYHHPLMGLIDYTDIRKQIQQHKAIFSLHFPGPYSKGMFPPENAFSNRMIPALVDEGIEWVLVDNIHFDRAAVGYPFSTSGNLYEPNKADQLNANPNDWVQLTNLWAPTKNSAKWGRQPHYAQYTDPETGVTKKMIIVPADRYLGNEDGRGGFGALQYESVMSQLESSNTDAQHPILIVLHHDGDNYGGGSEGYYHGNFQAFVNWLTANPNRFKCTTIQDYLQMFPPNPNDIIHVEDGSWAGADNGDPEFKKWNGDPGSTGYSPDRNSWGVITASKNIILTAEQIDANAQGTKDGWKYLANAEASDYWYWDGSEGGKWDSHPTRGSNLAVQSALSVANSGQDLTGPTIYVPQREPYNPGGTEWGIAQPNDFKVWSYVFDLKGVSSVKLKYRIDADGNMGNHNNIYMGGNEVGAWQEVIMTGVNIPSQTNPAPLYKALEYSAAITGLNNKLVDYYIEAVDVNNNASKSAIKHVWVGANTGGGGGGASVWWTPVNPTKNDTISVYIKSSQGAKLHWGVNYSGSIWQTPNQVYWPAGTVLFNGTGPAVETPFGTFINDTLRVKIGPFNNAAQNVSKLAFVIHYNDNTWNNNSGQDFHIDFGGGGTTGFVMDGNPDSASVVVSSNTGMDLRIGWNGTELYVATQSAPSGGQDVFIFIADSQKALINAPWAKAGQVASWNVFLANESTNNYFGWTDANGTYPAASGAWLEGALNIQNEFGYIPAKLYIAAGRYGTADHGTLQKQVPLGNGDGNIDANEFYNYNYVVTEMDLSELLPQNLALKQNYPNPFNPSTRISYIIHKTGMVTLKVYDMLGREVAVLVDETKSPGFHTADFNAKGFSSGVYFYSLQTEGKTQQLKMILMK